MIRNTLIAIVSYQAFKRDLYEGGIRVPMIATWPGKRSLKDTVTDQITTFWDFLSTMADLSGQPVPPTTDGVSILPTLLGHPADQQQHKYLYWEFPARNGRVAIRKGKWKAVRYNVATDPNSPLELYDLESDVGESVNVASAHPELISDFQILLEGARTAPANPAFRFV